MMMLVSMGVAIVGIFLAYKMYIKQPELPDKVTKKVPGLYDLIYNKYYVDELYDATIVEPDQKWVGGFVERSRFQSYRWGG